MDVFVLREHLVQRSRIAGRKAVFALRIDVQLKRDPVRGQRLRVQQAGMTQSMSRVAHCIDNGPMEGFWGILKRERYYGKRFTSKRELVQTIENYIHYYNTRRVQRNLGVLTPMEKHERCLAA